MTSLGTEKYQELHANVLYMVMAIERKVEEFERVNLNGLTQQLQQVEQQRQNLIANINQVQGAIQGGRIMVEEELAAAGVTREFYEQCKNDFLKELEEKKSGLEEKKPGDVIPFPEQGQSNENLDGATDNPNDQCE